LVLTSHRGVFILLDGTTTMKRETIIPKVKPQQTLPNQAIREYYRHLNRYSDRFAFLLNYALGASLQELRAVAKNELPDPHMDSNFYKSGTVTSSIRMDTNIEKRVADLLGWVERELKASFSEDLLRSWARSMIENTNSLSKMNTIKLTQAVGLDVEPLLHDRNLNPFFKNVIDENVGLIKSIPKYQMAAFKNKLVFAISKDMNQRDIQKIIADYIGASGNGERSAGNPSGLYPNAKPSHWARNGKTYSWNKPPEGGHPGERVGCGCHAQMVIEDVLK